MTQLTIFHTSDIHSSLTPQQANYLSSLKNDNPQSIFLDSGDAIKSGNIYFRPWGEAIFKLLNSVPYDGMCIGNREYHFLDCGLAAKTSGADFPLLCANLISEKKKKNRIVPYTNIKKQDIRITIFGLTVPCITKKMLTHKVSDFFFDNPINSAKEYVPKLRSECDLLIALTHIGLSKDIELAECVEGIDLILGGHTHTITQESVKIGKTQIIHHGSHAKWVGKVDINFGSDNVIINNKLSPLMGGK